MLTYIRFLTSRYLGEKGQGIVEYAVLLAFVVVVATVLTTDNGLKDAISGVFTKVVTALGKTS